MPTPSEIAARIVAHRQAQRTALAPVRESAREEGRRLYGALTSMKSGAKFQAEERAVVASHNCDLFPTPPDLAARMVELAELESCMEVVEPSAGTGRIALALRSAGIAPLCIELQHAAAQLLIKQGFDTRCQNFLDWGGEADRFVMNPPFSNGQDIAHVRHSFGRLRPGGLIVAIMGEGAFIRHDKQARAFREWLATLNAESDPLPPNTFKASGTSANARLVVIHKGNLPMNITIKINTDNAAFDESPQWEVAKILKRLAQTVVAGDFELRRDESIDLRDSNGNVVGQLKVTR